MLSYKIINLLDLYILDDVLMYKGVSDTLVIKTPIIIAQKNDTCLNLKINNDSESHDKLINVCGYINTLCSIKKINTDMIANNNIILKKTILSKFFDENRNIIPFSKIKNTQKMVCSFTCVSGDFLISECLLVN